MHSIIAVALLSSMVALSAGAAQVHVAAATINFIDYPKIEKTCGGPNIAACTTIITRSVSSCGAEGSRWHVGRYILVEPHVYTSSGSLLTHEFAHIADVVSALKKGAKAVEKQTFDSEDLCEAFAHEVDSKNARALLEIERATARRRDAAVSVGAITTPLAAQVAAEATGP